jgi:hypothetical protein
LSSLAHPTTGAPVIPALGGALDFSRLPGSGHPKRSRGPASGATASQHIPSPHPILSNISLGHCLTTRPALVSPPAATPPGTSTSRSHPREPLLPPRKPPASPLQPFAPRKLHLHPDHCLEQHPQSSEHYPQASTSLQLSLVVTLARHHLPFVGPPASANFTSRSCT